MVSRTRFCDTPLKRAAFTLIELLVVIAIIGLLVAILLPAVQKAREAAARTRCINNLKQLGVAIHNYHDTNGALPPGGANDQAGFGGTGAGSSNYWGSSWMIYILPYMEQQALYGNWQFTSQSGAFNAANNTLASGVVIPGYVCPSSPMPLKGVVSQAGSFHANYVAISGAVPGLIPNYTETRFNDLPCGGRIGGGGAMHPNSKTRFADITDGSSNTLAFGEQSNWLIDNNGVKQQWLASQKWGWYLGVKSPNQVPNFDNGGGDNRQPNMTTIRYTINYKPPGGWTNDVAGIGVGYSGNCVGANVPMNSAHTSGANVGYCDGSVRFLGNQTELAVLAQLATRDDGTQFSPP